MVLNYKEIEQIVNELNLIITGSLVNKIRKGFQKEIILDLYKDGLKYNLVIGVNPQFASLHLSTKEKTFPFIADTFTMFLRKNFTRRVLNSIKSVKNERIVVIEFNNEWKLIINLFPRGGNIFVTDKENNIQYSINSTSEKKYIFQEKEDDFKDKELSLKETDKALYNEYIAEKYFDKLKKLLKDTFQKKRLGDIKRNIKKTKKRLLNIQRDYDNCSKSKQFFDFGTIIMAYHSHDKRKGIKVLETNDLEGNSIEIALNQKKSILDNGQDFFKKSKKLKKALPILESRLKEDNKLLENLKNELKEIESASFDELKKNIKEDKKKKVKKVFQFPNFMIYINSKGFRILVGRNSDENDAIFRASRGKDIWFHNRDYPGSHVLIWVENKQPDEDTIKDAANLAILFSKSKDVGEGFVMMTKRKFLSKMAKMPKGQVNISSYKSVWVTLDKGRLDKMTKQV